MLSSLAWMLGKALRGRATRQALDALDDKQLKDIGLTRSQISEVVDGRATKAGRHLPMRSLAPSCGTGPDRDLTPTRSAVSTGLTIGMTHPQSGSVTCGVQGGDVLCLEDCAGSKIVVRTGKLWITQADDERDTVLHPGDHFQLDRHGLALATALRNSTFCIHAARPGLRPRLRFE